jgi:hypothetical protein
MRGLVCLVLAGILCAASVEAATRTAASCSRADVGTAVNSAADGDTIVIPAGTCTWSTNLTITNKILTIQGAGMNSTIIVDGVSKGNYPNVPQVISYKTKPGGLTRITGMTFQGGSAVDNNNKGMLWIDGNSNQFRLDHVKIRTTVTAGIHFHQNVLGVVDHNVFELSNWAYGVYIHHENWNNSGDFGDASWADATYLGTNKALYFEDNTFSGSGSQVAVDGWSGSRVVFRYNVLTNATFGNHGTETSGRWRSQRSFEVYNNTFNWNSMNWASMIGIRGGTGVIFNNTGTTSGNGYTQVVADLNDLRSSDFSRAYDPWGHCNGSNPWDGNQNGLGTGYPCLDQPGRGRGSLIASFAPSPIGNLNQALEPIYGWNNTLNGQNSALKTVATKVVVANRDFYNTPKPGYTPYTYPHPLTTGSGGGSGPSAPQNLRISSE